MSELETVKKELDNSKNLIENLSNQIEAAKQVISENSQYIFQLRANIQILSSDNFKKSNEILDLRKSVDSLSYKITELSIELSKGEEDATNQECEQCG